MEGRRKEGEREYGRADEKGQERVGAGSGHTASKPFFISEQNEQSLAGRTEGRGRESVDGRTKEADERQS